jgi:adenylate kinase family enzyme
LTKSNPHLKITIFGTPGSGKTTLARKLGESLGLPVFHIDKLMWDKGWVLRPREEFLADLKAITDLDGWIIEGTSISTLDSRYGISDVVIHMHPPVLLCLWRVTRRYLLNRLGFTGTPVDKPVDVQEALNWDFVKYIWNFEKNSADRLEMCKQKYPHVRLIEITFF